MDKNSFIKVLHHFSDSSVEEAQEIISLERRYPYSQLLHVLSARVSKDHGFSNHPQELQLAAVYASDRAVLKELMTSSNNLIPAVNSRDVSTGFRQQTITSEVQTIHSDNLAEEVLHDLERLSYLKHNFELVLANFSAQGTVTVDNEETSIEQGGGGDATENEDPIDKLAHDLKETPGLTKKQRIIALAKAAEALAATEAKDQASTEPQKKKENTGEVLIDEIANNKQEIDPETEKQKQQIEIIDQFIKAQPTLASAKDKAPVGFPQTDLSVKSGEFGDNIVSETLVDILLKQGKKDKAIEVLKKLIWKFPQKKAYFAAQIEELKK